LRNCRSQRTHSDCKSCNPVNEAFFMEIHRDRILSDLPLFSPALWEDNKKGVRRPL
jgi:hypothetical protein